MIDYIFTLIQKKEEEYILFQSWCQNRLADFGIDFHCRNEALRVAFIDEVETLKEGKVNKEYISKLVKADINGKDKVPFFFCSKIGSRAFIHFHYAFSI